jgi:organic radical activating enzyme
MSEQLLIADLIQNGKHFCIYPWVHLHVNGKGDMLPCCVSTSKGYGNVNTESFKCLWQGEGMRRFRLKTLNDEAEETCSICYENEMANGFSLRKDINFHYGKFVDWVANTDNTGYAPEAKPIYWDIRFSNICNLKCRTCGPINSSSWCNENRENSRFRHDEFKQQMNFSYAGNLLPALDEYLPDVIQIYCAGGEPLLMDENLTILKKLKAIDKYDVQLIYNTNLTQVHRRTEFIQYWKNIKSLKFLISLDGSHQRGEYLRKGMIWDDILHNLLFLKNECPHSEMLINFTVSVFNILHLPDFHKEMMEKKYIKADQLCLNILHLPEMYSVKIMPVELKQKATEKLLKHIAWLLQQTPCKEQSESQPQTLPFIQQWHACINYMNSEDWSHLLPNFIFYTNYIDEIRNENCLEIFPELEPLGV